ncbi:NUDIX hydrolase [Taibaiella chishuiensis]|uniref:NUDIX domain-containing protein n=1 Tax=Taibaiella chishuiensis TaxID=1434707 RepID=A0A2P8DCZ0_9BACT|nr:CoA pyrophosphatase [Taibaiella chishuiensis]PSK95088.1 NUDIX domain-containing protein [Taibaiella chishuiensis]
MEHQWSEWVNWLQQRLQQPLPGYEAQRKMMNINRPDVRVTPETARQSGVMLLLYPEAQDVRLVLIERTDDGGVHGGQIALPGGRKEDYDTDIVDTALREANEEVNLDRESVQVLGQLSPLYIPVSNFEVHPVIVVSDRKPELSPSEAEVARILYLSLSGIFADKDDVEVRPSGFPNMTIRTVAYMMNDTKYIWGATAMILSELEAIWEERPGQ